MSFDYIDQLVEMLSIEELKNKEHVSRIIAELDNNKDLILYFVISKNIKIYGGIDPYLNSFLNQLDDADLDVLGIEGRESAMLTLRKILDYPISEEKKTRIKALIRDKLSYAAARGAGKSRRKKIRRKSRKYAY